MPDISLRPQSNDDRKYTISNKNIMLRLPTNRQKWGKWDGLWNPPIKFMDSYYINIDGHLLDFSSMKEFIMKPWGGIHRFSTKDLEIEESCFMPEGSHSYVAALRIKNISGKKHVASISLDARIDMREGTESIHGREYLAEFDKVRNANRIISKDKRWNITYGFGRCENIGNISLKGSSRYVNDKGRSLFIPKRIASSVSIESGASIVLPIIFCAGQGNQKEMNDCYDMVSKYWDVMKVDKERIYDCLKKGHVYSDRSEGIRTPDPDINKAFFWSYINLMNLGTRANNPVDADIDIERLLWSTMGLILIGRFKKAKEMLIYMFSICEEGRLPSRITSDNLPIYDNDSVTPMLLIILKMYVESASDKTFETEMREDIITTIRTLRLDSGLASPSSRPGTMDYLDDSKARVELQSMWIEALKTYHPTRHRLMSEALDKYFWDHRENFIRDTLKHDAPGSAKVLMPLFFKQLTDIKIDRSLKKIRQEFIADHGIRSRGVFDPDFRAGDPRLGATRPFDTAMASIIFLKSGDDKTGKYLLDMLSRHIFNHNLGVFQDVMNSSTGEPLNMLDSTDTSAMMIHSVDSGLFGIRPRMHINEIDIKPRLIDGWEEYERFGKMLGDNRMHIKVSQKNKRFVDVVLNFSERPDFRVNLEMPDSIGMIEINKVKTEGNKTSFRPLKNNRIWAYHNKR